MSLVIAWLERSVGLLAFAAIVASAPAMAGEAKSGGGKIDFSREIRPILANHCFQCHGPDPGKRKAGLRLDTPESALAETESGSRAVVPGKLDESELYLRITSDAADEHMPPAKSGKPLSASQIELLKTWIEQGASFRTHWAFLAPSRPAVPQVKSPSWGRSPIDAFILARLEAEKLVPSPEADKVTLLRRLSLDLIGLPPTPEEVDAFLLDNRPDAYERQVERLLSSPHYGERWGRIWLDGARYADSDGFEKDKSRQVWFYRDWVIRALNQDLPYNQFIIDQIAGDLLPGATQDQRVATGFLRNSMINEEGGIDPEQFRMEAMYDRMDAIGKSILGLTIQCAQCHSHKYDPLAQEDYYRMFAFLNNCHEANIAVYTPEEQSQRDAIFRQIRQLETELQQNNPGWQEQIAAWEREVSAKQTDWRVLSPSVDDISTGGQKYLPMGDGSFLAQGYAPTKHRVQISIKTDVPNITAARLELMNDPNLPMGGPGRSIMGTCALTEFEVEAAPADKPDKKQKIKISCASADINPSEKPLEAVFDDKSGKKRVTGPIAYAIDHKDETAWGIDAGPGRRNEPRKAVFVFEQPVANPQGTILTFYLKQNHGGWNSDDNQNNNLGRFRLSITSEPDAQADPLPRAVRDVLAIPYAERTAEQNAAVFSFWRTTVSDWKAANARIEALWQQHPEGSTQLVLNERTSRRPTHLLQRGDFLKPQQEVTPGVPAFLHPLPADAPANRLTFARWLVDRRSPTTARAIVNRVWQAYFGTGIVSTSEDLGTQSEPPSHPELLDWLAVEFMDGGWSLKTLHRRIVCSAVYRQSSYVTPELYTRDPYNRLLARGPRFRVDAEIVRDIALAASGLLNDRVGGPSVYTPAPDFLFLPPASYGPKIWQTATGSDRYRRALYTFRYRSVPYPMLQNFDAPNGDFSCVRRTRSNTPLQALTTLNEPIFMDCARALAVRTVQEGGDNELDRLSYAFRRCLARTPTASETATLLGLYDRQARRFATGTPRPETLLTPESLQALPKKTTPAQLAAWTAVARVLLNLDEMMTKE